MVAQNLPPSSSKMPKGRTPNIAGGGDNPDLAGRLRLIATSVLHRIFGRVWDVSLATPKEFQ